MHRPPLTFARLVPLPENRLALAAVQRLADRLAANRPDAAVNPLFLHGPPGSGKTHLVSALRDDLIQRRPSATVVVVSASDEKAASATDHADLTLSLCDCDLLVIEDIQHLPASSAEAWVQALDDRLARHGHVVVTAAMGPRNLPLPTRLTSRLAAGLVVGVEPLQAASRLALLQDKAQRRQLPLGRDVLAWLAEHVKGSGRQLEGVLTQVEHLARVHKGRLTAAVVAEFFQDHAAGTRPTIDAIVQRVGKQFEVEPRQLISPRRSHSVLLPRQVSMYLVRRITGMPLEKIGAYFGGRDHSTVLHACRKIERTLTRDPILAGALRQLQAALT